MSHRAATWGSSADGDPTGTGPEISQIDTWTQALDPLGAQSTSKRGMPSLHLERLTISDCVDAVGDGVRIRVPCVRAVQNVMCPNQCLTEMTVAEHATQGWACIPTLSW